MKKMLMLHPNGELYGSDRSFFSIARACYKDKCGDYLIDIFLPHEGELSSLFRSSNVDVRFHEKGILRKSVFSDLMSTVKFVFSFFSSVLYFRKMFSSYDIVYINTVIWVSPLVASFFHKDKRIICHVREIPSPLQSLFFNILLKFSGASVIYNSKATKNAFSVDGSVIYNGVSEVGKGRHYDEFRTIPSKSSVINVLVIGRLNNWKGQDFFLRALSNLPEKFKVKIRVRVVGSAFGDQDDILANLKKICFDHNLEKLVDFFPFVDDPSEHYVWSNFVVVPSKRPEPFGRVAIESFSFKRPVIAAAHGGLCEIVSSGENGLLFEPNSERDLLDKLTDCMQMSDVDYLSLAEGAYRTYKSRFSEASYLEETLQNIFLKK